MSIYYSFISVAAGVGSGLAIAAIVDRVIPKTKGLSPIASLIKQGLEIGGILIAFGWVASQYS